ncbi:SpoIID/LytB domain-containing protein [Clostridium cylindrosporum]|uniref:SpoIID/LytB domain-containing protein n=1 Tax=Clostridium cylindrosporum DSM 605 TaxID=1121307 RepID=A0A0J8D887_CLOCY|nr:SpoIID/LytB domain-containing protein [Clostridium cylindrosporum]KMT22077.1 SpoIID/LytB domain-containing protein [Clostridium cylindrosporum DSM 605]
MKKNIIYITISLVFFILFSGIYYIFLGTQSLNYSIILDKKKVTDGQELRIYQNGDEKTLIVPNTLTIKPSPSYNIKLRGKKVISIEPVKYYSGKVISIKGSEVHLVDSVIKTTSKTKYYKVEGKSISEISDKSLMVGYQGYRFIMDKNNNVKIVLCSIPKVNRIRTLISNSDFSTRNHKEIKFFFNSEAELKSKDLNYKFAPNDSLIVTKEGAKMNLSLVKGSSTTSIGNTSSRIEIIQGDSTRISIPSNTRKNGYIPSYYGSFELSLDNSGIKLINEAYINNYLKGVVPSEMPSSGGVEGYKIQSIVSRTAAIYSILSKEYASLGVHAIDCEPSQLYEASPGSPQSDEAIESTSGEVVTKDGDVIDAKYYSTSPGFGASYDDVFGKVTPSKDYLTASSFNQSGNKINVHSEDDITQYLKDWTVKAHDSNSPLFRWKYSIDYTVLTKLINNNLYDLYVKNPNHFKEKWHFFLYKEAKIPRDGIGKIKDINITDRTSSGIVSEIKIESENNIYKITGNDILRKLLIPKEGFELTTIYGKPLQNLTILPSPFFTIEKNMSGDKFKSITIYGGGEGHGVGLSKYGAIGLSRHGLNYKKVITSFYPSTETLNIDKDFRLEVENRNQ